MTISTSSAVSSRRRRHSVAGSRYFCRDLTIDLQKIWGTFEAEILKQATRAEKTTERNFIHATRNSARSHKDGDHVAGGEITLDTKLQTTREIPWCCCTKS